MAALRREGDELVVKLNVLEKAGARRGDVRSSPTSAPPRPPTSCAPA
jgi:hypothetical protein